MFGRGRLNLTHAWNDNLPRVTTAGGGGRMLYGIIAAVDRLLISNKSLLGVLLDVLNFNALDLVALDFVEPYAPCARPRARSPDTPSSTRAPRARFCSSNATALAPRSAPPV